MGAVGVSALFLLLGAAASLTQATEVGVGVDSSSGSETTTTTTSRPSALQTPSSKKHPGNADYDKRNHGNCLAVYSSIRTSEL